MKKMLIVLVMSSSFFGSAFTNDCLGTQGSLQNSSNLPIKLEAGSGIDSSILTTGIQEWNNCANLGFPSFSTQGDDYSAIIRVQYNSGQNRAGGCGSLAEEEATTGGAPGSRVLTLYAQGTDTRGNPFTCNDLANNLAHELGHFLGLADLTDVTGPCRDVRSIMRPQSGDRAITADDCAKVDTMWQTQEEFCQENPTNPLCRDIKKADPCSPSSEPMESCNHSPILIDLGGDNIQAGGPGTAIDYDLYNDGNPVHIQWVQANQDDAFLVRDINANGIVDNGSELFGNGTVLEITEELAGDGFEALAQFDIASLGGNGDKYISSADQVWKQLALWIDADADGICHDSEMIDLESVGITRLSITPHRVGRIDEYGNLYRYWDWAYQNGNQRKKVRMIDIFFKEITH